MAARPRSPSAPSGSPWPQPRRRDPPCSASDGSSAATGRACAANRWTSRCGWRYGSCGPAVAADEPPARESPGEVTRRLFFALWPDEGMQGRLAEASREAARASGGRPVPANNLHVTLAFLGSVAQRRLPELGEVAREAAESTGPALELSFDHLEHWRAANLLVASPAEPPAPVKALARGLQDLLVRRGFTPDLKP